MLVLIGLAGYQVSQKGLGEDINRQLTLKLLKAQIKRHPQNARAYLYLGDFYFKLERRVEAVAAYRQALVLNPDNPGIVIPREIIRSDEEAKQKQLDSVKDFQAEHASEVASALQSLKKVCLEGGNIFDELMKAANSLTLGQISNALYEVGGQYRRNM